MFTIWTRKLKEKLEYSTKIKNTKGSHGKDSIWWPIFYRQLIEEHAQLDALKLCIKDSKFGTICGTNSMEDGSQEQIQQQNSTFLVDNLTLHPKELGCGIEVMGGSSHSKRSPKQKHVCGNTNRNTGPPQRMLILKPYTTT